MMDDDIADISYTQILISIAIGFPVYLIFQKLGEPFIGFLSASTIACGLVVFFILNKFARSWKFWLAMVFLGSLHAAAIYSLPVRGEFRFGFAYFPIFFIDAYVSSKFIIWFVKNR